MPTLYRIIKTASPTVTDFTSNQALGRPPRGIERVDPSIWSGLSMHNSQDASRAQARRIPNLGAYIARLDFTADSGIQFRQTGSDPAHHTVWGEPAELLACVIAVQPVGEEQRGV